MSLSSSFQPCQDPHKKLSFSLITLVTSKINVSLLKMDILLRRFLKTLSFERKLFCHKIMENIDSLDEKIVKKAIEDSLKNYCSRAQFRSTDLWVMGPARFHCATLLSQYKLQIKQKHILKEGVAARVNLIAKA